MKSANQVHKLPQRLGKSIIYAMEKSPARWANMIVYICMPAISKTVPLSVAWAIVFFAVVAADPCFCYAFNVSWFTICCVLFTFSCLFSPSPLICFSRRRRQFCYFPIVATRLFVVRCSAVCLLLSSPPTSFLFPFIVCSSPPSPTRFSAAIFARDGRPSLRPAFFFFTKLTMSQSRHKPNATTKSKKKRLIQNTTK